MRLCLMIEGQEGVTWDDWTALAGLAARTERIQLGTMVSPATFRHPSLLAKSVVTVDHISGGRAELGIGAGWYEDEHRAYGFPFADTKTRMAVLEEQIEIVVKSWQEGPFDLRGEHYTIEDLDALPKPVSKPHPTRMGVGRPGSWRPCALRHDRLHRRIGLG